MSRFSSSSFRRYTRVTLAAAVLAVCAVTAVACASSGAPAVTPPPASSPVNSEPSPSGPAPSGPAAPALLEQAQKTARSLKNYAFDMHLTQRLTGSSAEGNSSVSVKMLGRAEQSPLKLDQQIQSNIDGEATSIRAILVPDAYYVYEPEFEEWSKTPKEETANITKTLSDFQVNPAKALQSIESLGSGLQTELSDNRDTIRYEGNGAQAKAFLENLLESTLDLSGMDPKVRESIKLGSLKVELVLDAVKHWPLSYKIESVMTVEYEAGKPSTLSQTFSGTYTKQDASKAVIVPDAAKNAPDPDAP
jgi:hypothetical protein